MQLSLKLKWKLSVVFGLLGVFLVIAATWATYTQAFYDFNKELADKLMALAALIDKYVDRDRLVACNSVHDPYYKELKTFMRAVQIHFNLPWIAMYRYDGKMFTHIVDGADRAGEFVPEYPIMDVPDEMQKAWDSGQPGFTTENVDAYGSWATAYYPIKNASGTVIAIVDASKSNERLDRFKSEIIAKTVTVAIVLTLLTLIVCILFSGYLTGPIMALTATAKRIAAGDLKNRITGITSRDEIGTLVTTFNSMTEELVRSKDSLERKIHELTTLYEISQKINFAGNTQEILRLILEKAVVGLKAERGSILLFNEDTGKLVLNVVFGGGVEEGQQRIEIEPGEGVAGKVFQDLQPMVLNDDIETHFKPYEPGIPWKVTNIMCLPLLVDKKGTGVMNIVNKGEGGFTSSDLALGTTMASQIALTMEKSRLYELSITDGLTKLFVHRYFQVALANEVRRAKRYQKTVSLILFDIDHFKKFNDTWGHQMGDVVLATSSSILRDSLRTVDIPARYGGEEFAVILPETDIMAAAHVAERLRKAIEKHEFPGPGGEIIKVTISLGVAACPQHALEKLDLIKKADDALYQSKHDGRNRVTIYKGEEASPKIEPPDPAKREKGTA